MAATLVASFAARFTSDAGGAVEGEVEGPGPFTRCNIGAGAQARGAAAAAAAAPVPHDSPCCDCPGIFGPRLSQVKDSYSEYEVARVDSGVPVRLELRISP